MTRGDACWLPRCSIVLKDAVNPRRRSGLQIDRKNQVLLPTDIVCFKLREMVESLQAIAQGGPETERP